MKKHNISIDFIAFGDLQPENTKKLEAFNEKIKSAEGSHLEIIPPGPSLLSDHLVTTPILAADGVAPRSGEDGMSGEAGAGGGGFDFGVDPSTDPELALALRMSMEEEKARHEKETKDTPKEPTLEGIPEERGETQPLLNEQGEASGSGGETAKKDEGGEKKETSDEKKGDGAGDKMDTA